MKCSTTIYLGVSKIGLLLLAMTICATSFAQKVAPPIPKEPISDLKMPEPLSPEIIEGKASLPATTRIGFALDLDNQVLVGDWKAKGRVTAIDAQKLTFITPEDREGNLVFRWPKEFKMPAKVNEMVTILRTAQTHQAALEKVVSIDRDGKPAVSYGRVFGAEPRNVLLPTDIKIEQTRSQGPVLSNNKFETIKQIPVFFAADGKRFSLEIGRAQLVKVGEEQFRVLISTSILVIPTPAFEGVAEGAGYVLEYLLIRE